ncbi:hypothetical protein [Jannaschia formosa]|uniref:hypothetical protein n=1 Tax=Jannaschia formosa TaxID=2259592 RepID=UPI0010756699|nr:hypothetical protein [Jannaschia formosa]TFL16492.1 hypothetical protein DR046_19905 [Jannaschia formosa]
MLGNGADDFRLRPPLIPVRDALAPGPDEVDQIADELQRQRVRRARGHGAHDLLRDRQVVADDPVLVEADPARAKGRGDGLPERGEQEGPRPLGRVPGLLPLAAHLNVHVEDPARKPLLEILSEFDLTRDDLLRRTVGDQHHLRQGRRERLQRAREGVEAAGEQDDLVGLEGMLLGLQVEIGLGRRIGVCRYEVETNVILRQELDRGHQCCRHVGPRPGLRMPDWKAEGELATPSLPHLLTWWSAPAHAAVGGKHRGRDLEEVERPRVDLRYCRRPDHVRGKDEVRVCAVDADGTRIRLSPDLNLGLRHPRPASPAVPTSPS